MIHPRLPLLSLFRLSFLLLALLAGHTAWAQAPDDVAEVRALEREVEALRRETDADGDRTMDERRALVVRARAVLEKAELLRSTLAAPATQIEQRIEQLGKDAAKSPDPAVREQHAELNRELTAHVALSRRTALSQVEATQALDSLNRAQTRALGQELFQRSASPLTPSLWVAGLAGLQAEFARTAAARPAPTAPPRPLPMVLLVLGAWAGVAWLLMRPGQFALQRLGMAVATRVSGWNADFARALFAVWSVLAGTLLPAVAALLAVMGVHWALPGALLTQLTTTTVSAVVIGLGARAAALAILQPARPAWRLWPLGDATAALGARAGNALAAAIALVVAVEAVVDLLKPGPPATVFVASALALASTAQIAYGLYRIDGMRRIDDGWMGTDGTTWRARLALWVGLGWLALLVLALFGVFGYVNLANRLSQWAIWGTVVLLVTFILMAFVDGLCKLLATAGARPGPDGSSGLALQQAAVLISAVGRLLLLALACGALLVPFGAGFTSVLSLLRPLATGFEIGGVSISAVALLRALLAFVVVVLLIRFIRSWMTKSYFPTTTLQPDARDSIDKMVRYAGVVLGILWGLTAFGVGMEKVAILASALSVGIGFGLQAITQNFVSGLILLVERPVRIGDWVKVNDVEGDIRRINVRSTEIRVGDHSTMIVPNSELITKVVQNKTMGQSLGRAQILLSVPLEADLDQAIATIAAALAADDEVLKSPAPAVFLDRVEGGMAVLNCFVHVHSPRVAYGVRSRVILAALRALRSRGILGTLPAQQFVPSPATPA